MKKRIKQMSKSISSRCSITISIKAIILASFIILLSATVGITGLIVFSSWSASAEETTVQMAADMNREVAGHIGTYMHVPQDMIEANRGLLDEHVIDIYNERMREAFFVNILNSYGGDSVYSFSYGTAAGDYYGARKNKDSVVEIMRNNPSTLGHSWYYSVTGDSAAGALVQDAGLFDVRTRAWYKAAVQARGMAFSPIYKHFVMEDLTISAAIPIMDDAGEISGVLGSHMLLSTINGYLETVMKDKKAYAVIVEKTSGNMIANSFGSMNYQILAGETFERLAIGQTGNKMLIGAYNRFMMDGSDRSSVDNGGDTFLTDIIQYRQPGLDWLIIVAVPEKYLSGRIDEGILWTFTMAIIAIILSVLSYLLLTKKYLAPLNGLLESAENLSSGDLSHRAVIVRNDEIGKLSQEFNKMAETIHDLVERMENEKEQFKMTLLSVGDAVISADENGKILMMNPAAEKLTGWPMTDACGEYIGNVLAIIDEKTRTPHFDLTVVPIDSEMTEKTVCQKLLVTRSGREIPIVGKISQIKDRAGNISGVVIVFRDFTQEKEKFDQITHFSFHDHLTGLYNRRYIENAIEKMDIEANLPFTIMVLDVNGLKLTNDAFGHETGDRVLKEVTAILKNVCRPDDILGRMGGDEFFMLLPKTPKGDAENMKKRIMDVASSSSMNSMIVSLALGYSVKTSMDEPISDIIIDADNDMYKHKLKYSKTMKSKTLENVLRNIDFYYKQEKIHTERVSQYCGSLAKMLDFSDKEIQNIRCAGKMHDIGKIMVPPELLNKEKRLTEEEYRIIRRHPQISYQILKSVEEYAIFAKDVLYHHERWDGTGYPEGLKAESIPLNSRIICIADMYEAMTAVRPYQSTRTEEAAIDEIRKCAGSQLDPRLARIFVEKVLCGQWV